MSYDVFNSLNEEQKKAVQLIKGPSVILAGAGSGKTRVLIHKVLNLILNQSVYPGKIVMITFTNKAASEMKERIAKFSEDLGQIRLGFVGTFHSFCCLILRRDGEVIGLDSDFVIYDDDDQKSIVKKILKDLHTKYSPAYFLNRISEAKNQLINSDNYLDNFAFNNASEVAEVYEKYQKQLKKNKAVDFDDLLMKTVELFQENKEILEKYQERYQHLMVDEFQDTNFAQYLLTKLLAKKYRNLTVVGDFAQSIYSWRGAEIKNLEKVSEDFPEAEVINLRTNYRSTQNILDYAYDVISKNQLHPVLLLKTDNDTGDEITFFEAKNEQEEAIYIAQNINRSLEKYDMADIAVLYRTNAQSRVIEEAFLHFSIPYKLIGGTRFYARKEIKDVLSYLRLFVNPDDSTAVDRIKKLGKRRWDKYRNLHAEITSQVKELSTIDIMEKVFTATGYLDMYNKDVNEDYARLENIRELKSVANKFNNIVEFLQQVALVESEYSEGEKSSTKNNEEGVRLMTLHQAKGLEFAQVFIAGLEEGLLPHSRSIDDIFMLEEERRLFYVGITRAKQNLHLTYTKSRYIFGRKTFAMKSQFIRSPDDYNEDDFIIG
jgi:DNA helicase-2/ATP-dependent DNA helicase PcrA